MESEEKPTIPPIIYELVEVFQKYTKRAIPGVTNDIDKISLPILPASLVVQICQLAEYAFKQDPFIMRFDGNITVVGDLHGHLPDLFRIFQKCGWPPAKKYLFLGDIIDRGEFSLETILIILVLKISFPENVFVIRGNHEFPDMYKKGGFLAEIVHFYKEIDLEPYFFSCFSQIPIAALIANKVLCLHGGIGPSVGSIADIERTPKPLIEFNSEPQQTILWSDPNEYSTDFEPSSRGLGYFFGEECLSRFLSKNNLTLLVRGHECVEKGVECVFKKKCMTVFSASRYCNSSANKAGVTHFKEDGQYEVVTFPAVKLYLLRAKALFQPLEYFTTSVTKTPCHAARPQRRVNSQGLPSLKTNHSYYSRNQRVSATPAPVATKNPVIYRKKSDITQPDRSHFSSISKKMASNRKPSSLKKFAEHHLY